MHTVEPVELQKKPAGHLTHADWPMALAYVPCSQTVHAVLPATEKVPVRHIWGVVELQNHPAAHITHAVAPCDDE